MPSPGMCPLTAHKGGAERGEGEGVCVVCPMLLTRAVSDWCEHSRGGGVFMHARVAVLTTAGVHAMLLTAQVVVDRKSVGIPLHGLGLTPAP